MHVPKLPWFHFHLFNYAYPSSSHSANAALIYASVFPAALALSMSVFVRSEASIYSSPGWISTPNLAAMSCNCFYFLILPILEMEPCKSAKALKFGMLAFS
jgi:hypothetical protein